MRAHDDMVIACAMAAQLAVEKGRSQFVVALGGGNDPGPDRFPSYRAYLEYCREMERERAERAAWSAAEPPTAASEYDINTPAGLQLYGPDKASIRAAASEELIAALATVGHTLRDGIELARVTG